ncbi:hypothetical protein ACIGXM_35920 [Kitasatospora sp. NPDC052896]|uniref:hypothetical protein n=1 Tax=Kitasatospora sp. NPDC052896 TaxID=3364061 RepID=UPI0037CAEEE5
MPDVITQLAQRIAALEAALPELSRSSRLAHSSVDDGALTVTAEGKVRAIIGQQPDGTTALNVVNGPPPPVPQPPTATSVLGGVLVTGAGEWADSAVCPLDFSRIEVHAYRAPGHDPDTTTLVSTIESPRGGSIVVPTQVPIWVRLVARTTSGRASAASREATASPAKVVADEVLAGVVGQLQLADGAVTAAKTAIGAITAPAIADGAITTGKLAAAAVTAQTIAAGAIQAGAIAADAVAAGTIAAEAVTGREIKALSITGDKIAANSITAGQLAAGAVTATALSADAINGRTITGVTIQGATVTGGQMRTAEGGRRVEITPTDPIRSNPAAVFYSGADTELLPGLLSASVNTTGTMSVPQLTPQAPSIDKSTSWMYPSDAASLRLTSRSAAKRSDGAFYLSAAAGANELGMVNVRGIAPSDQASASFAIDVRNPVPTSTNDVRNTYVEINGKQATFSFNATSYLLDANGWRCADQGWQPISYLNGWSDLPDWRKVEVRRMPDGTAVLRGIARTPGGFTGGRIGILPDNGCRPKAAEVIPVANDNSSKCCVFLYPDGGVDISSNAGWPGNWISFGYACWLLSE